MLHNADISLSWSQLGLPEIHQTPTSARLPALMTFSIDVISRIVYEAALTEIQLLCCYSRSSFQIPDAVIE